MRMMQVAIQLLAVGALSCGVAANALDAVAQEGKHDPSPFHAASVAPADVTLLLQIDDAAAIRHDLADRPIARWLTAMIEASKFHQSWQRLAAQAGRESADLFDRCFGRRVTLLHRRAGDGRENDEWALITRISVNDSTDLLRRLQPRTLRSSFKFAIYELPEHDLLLARRGETMLVGPRHSPLLMQDVLSRLGTGSGAGKPLSEADEFAAARELRAGNIAVFMRHQQPLGGYSAAVLKRDGEYVQLKHRARFDSPPFSRAVTRIDIDASPLEALEDHALLAIIEPADIGMGPFETFILAAIGEGLISPALRENLSDRRIIVLGDIEGRKEQEPVDILAPTITLAMEIKQADGALADMDQQVVKLVHQLAARGGDQFTIDIPDASSFAGDRPRQIDISSATRWFTGSLPVAQPMTLNWSIVAENDRQYAVFATHPDALRDTMSSLARTKPAREQNIGRFQSCGTVNGVRISHHLESWVERPDLFLGMHAADGAKIEFQQSLKLMAQFAAGIDRLRWHLARPSTNEMQLDIRATLTAPESARPE